MIAPKISALHPRKIVVMVVAGWINRQQLEVIECLSEGSLCMKPPALPAIFCG